MDISAAAAPLGRLAVRIDNYRPFDGEVVIWAGVGGEQRPAIVGVSGAWVPVFGQISFRPADPVEGPQLATRLKEDGVRLPDAIARAPRIVRASIRVNDHGESALFGVDFGGPVSAAMARAVVDQSNPKRATVCTHEFGDTDAWPDAAAPLVITPLSAAAGFGAGWYDVERHSDDRVFRWTAAACQPGRAAHTSPRGRADPRGRAVRLPGPAPGFDHARGQRRGHRLAAHADGPGHYAWDIAAEQWRSGLNELTFTVQGAKSPREAGVSDDGRVLGVLVTRITLDAERARDD